MQNIFIIITIIICSFTNIYINIRQIKTVENFCSIKHQRSVINYKACKKLGANELIIKLAKEEQNKYENLIPLTNLK